ncbi:type I restriction endonuclease subunit R [Rufibacter tibetensis]|uniref:Type I restriction enzyme endonuclease subunit n=1 Tax=Rufibacter tibetensis TaxID=512763 RepID=A0A0P0C5N1_9BACT|nr:type I restriction endonuclease subunit R [Rufibacter tibetensis]ALI98565.1 hypothetical protein DC20_05765 [Rufibacter tibetensis]
MAFLNESHVEEADIKYFEKHLGYQHINAWKPEKIGRESLKEVVLRDRLTSALTRLNPDLPASCINFAADEFARSRASLTPIMANKEIYELIKKGVPVTYTNQEGKEQAAYAQVINFENPSSKDNEFLVVSQLSIEYLQVENTTRRPDLLLYVNGLPLVMIELKNATEKAKVGYDKNLKDYRRDIPQLFWYNLFVCVSNGIETRVGSFNAGWEHFFTWVKLKDTAVDQNQLTLGEVEAASKKNNNRLSLKLFGEGLCNKDTLLDYFENFVLYHKNKVKILAKNHQYLGVNNAFHSLATASTKEERNGKLGVFWHTQGSGKSYSMIFFSKKVNYKLNGNWSFLIITDRRDLDDQIYRNFVETETVIETKGQKQNYYRPSSREKLQEYLQSNRSYLFTLIHKFSIEKGRTFPKLTDRDNWIVMVDEAHRTQYKGLAENMRIGLPKAQYIAFTGTPLLQNELTKDWFGPYVSEYNFAQSIEDGATVPMFYKKSVPRVEQANENLVGEAAQILEEENLSEEQKKKLEKEYSTLLQVVRRDDRLNEIAKHIVQHFPYRLDAVDENGHRKPMKAMVISIDKFTAVRMYEKVQHYLKEEIKELHKKAKAETDLEKKTRYERAITFMKETRMAAVVSQEGSEKEEEEVFKKAGLEIRKHRRLMDYPSDNGQNIEDYFKDPNNTYRIVFVTAMWLTGFDAPSVSTIYLDKPLQNHTLMQTIARANRVIEGKKNGLVIDYFGVFRNLKKALADYAEGSKGKKEDPDEEFPVREFEILLQILNEAISEAKSYCKDLGADIDSILAVGEKGFREVELFNEYANIILEKDEYRKQLNLFENTISSLYDSAKPEIYDYPEIKKARDVFEYLRKVVDRQIDQDEETERAKRRIDELLDISIVGQGDLVVAHERVIMKTASLIDLSKLNFAKLREQFTEKEYKNIEFTNLREVMDLKMRQMMRQNKMRGGFLERFQKVIDDYNSGSLSIEEAYEELVKQAEDLSEEQTRAAREGMTEGQLEIFDLLSKDKSLTKEEEKKVKLAAQDLLTVLYDAKNKILIQEWHKEKKTQEVVRRKIQEILDLHLPASYERNIFIQKTDVVFQHLYEQAELGYGFAA